jgi:outer membrane protein assembly factor BamB
MKTKFTTAVIYDGYVYGLDDGILACVDLKTGKRKWKGGRYQHGQLLLVGEWLVIQAEEGDVVLVRATPRKLDEVGRLPALSSKTWNNPALNKEYLVVRNDQEAICFRISSAKAETAAP